MTQRSVEAFGEQAERYDRDAELLMGDRPRHRRHLRDLLGCIAADPAVFVDLGCGTGYFTEVFFEAFPNVRGIGVDGSEPMLEKARERLHSRRHDLNLRRELLQSIDWSTIDPTALVFSAFAIHHLTDDEKVGLFGRIFQHLEPAGWFILFDSFRPDDRIADELIERITCLEIQRRVRGTKGAEVPLDRIIARDRETKAAEGDQEASFEAHLRWLRDVGFEHVVPVFLDARMGGIVAIRSTGPRRRDSISRTPR